MFKGVVIYGTNRRRGKKTYSRRRRIAKTQKKRLKEEFFMETDLKKTKSEGIFRGDLS